MLTSEQIDFIQGGISISLAACGLQRATSLARAVGCRFDPVSARLSVVLRRSRAEELLALIADSGRVTGVFCQPSTNRTLQIKGLEARIEAFPAADRALVDRHLDALVAEIRLLGVPEAIVRTIFCYDIADLVAVSYRPSEIYAQTPGPKAGEKIGNPS